MILKSATKRQLRSLRLAHQEFVRKLHLPLGEGCGEGLASNKDRTLSFPVAEQFDFWSVSFTPWLQPGG